MCACFQTTDTFYFGAELFFAIQTDKTQRHLGAVALLVIQELFLYYCFRVYKIYERSKDKINIRATFNETRAQTVNKDVVTFVNLVLINM